MLRNFKTSKTTTNFKTKQTKTLYKQNKSKTNQNNTVNFENKPRGASIQLAQTLMAITATVTNFIS